MWIELFGIVLIWAGIVGFMYFCFRALLGIHVPRDVKYARIRIEMESGHVQYGTIPYRSKETLAYSLALVAKAKYRQDKSGEQIKIVADVVKSVMVVHDNWPVNQEKDDGNQD